MPFQKVEYEFPDETEESSDLEIESSSALEIDVSGKAKPAKEAAAIVEEEVEEEVEEDDSYEVEVVDDTPKADRNRKPAEPPEDITDEELEDYSEKVRKRIQHFSKGYHDERRAKESALRERQELEKLAQQLVSENQQLKGTVDKNQEVLLEQAKRTAAGEAILAKRAYKAAYEAGDADKLLDAQEKLTNAKIKTDRLDNFRPPALQQQETPVQTEEIQGQTAPAPIVDERANDWATSNTWFGEDDEMTSLALGLHNRLVKEGVNPQSDDYYVKIDSRMREIFPDKFEDGEPEQRKRRTNVVAPATRSTAPKKIRLTQTQVTIAKRLGLTPEQYAKQVAIDMRKQ
jgi:hypothetical protein|tara:strand:- start:24 stop:1058 length:1035 start_codon:yes stop_codon:yes gene_type:complete